MNLDDWRAVFESVTWVLLILASTPVLSQFIPRNEEHFFALAVLGEKGIAEHYYPDDNPHIKVGEEVNWTIYLYNHMGEAQYVAIKIKLLNSTMAPPNSTTCTPSPATTIYEDKHIIMNNETGLYPLSWTIENITIVDDTVKIEQLSINNETIQADSVASMGYNYRFVIELWVFSEELNDFQFGWFSNNKKHGAWNQIWFNAIQAFD